MRVVRRKAMAARRSRMGIARRGHADAIAAVSQEVGFLVSMWWSS